MKKQLLKTITMFVACFATIAMYAQPGPTLYDYAGGAQSWVKGYGDGIVAHDPAEGVTADGALTLDRLANNNANIRRGQGGDDAFIVLDADVVNFIKLTVKNGTMATNIRVAGTSRPASTSGAGTSFTAINVNGVLTQENPNFETVYLDVTAITGEVTRLDILFRANAASDAPGSLVVIDDIEFLASIPQTNSEFILSPGFEDATGLAHMSGPQTQATRALTSAQASEGLQSMSTTFIADATAGTPVWNFSSHQVDYASGVITPTTTVNVKMWVRSTRSTPARIIVRLRTANLSGSVLNNPGFPTATAVTSGTPNTWEELSFDMTIGTFVDADPEVRSLRMWFGVDSDDPDTGLNGVNGDVFYFDDMSAEFGTLSIKGNTLEGVSMYPNPASDVLTLNTPQGGDITVFNILGAQVKADKTDLKQYRMNVSDLKSGMYLLKVTSEGKQFTQKLVID